MNPMDELEAQLRSWAPRRPSAKLELRLFHARPDAVETAPPFRLGWLAPAGAALFLLSLVAVQHPIPGIQPSQSNPMFAEILSNQNTAAFLPGSFADEQNRVPVNRYEWTPGLAATSSTSAVLPKNRKSP
jgi:hypothetical protein